MKGINHKNKLILLGIGTCLLFYLIYSLAISETIALQKNAIESQIKLETITKAPQEIESIRKKMDAYAAKMGKTTDTTWHNEPFLEFVSETCKKNNAILNDYASPHIFEQGDFRVETRIAMIGGQFFDLVKVLHQIEQGYVFGKNVSANFELKEDFRTNTKHLYVTLYVQSVINHTSSENKNKL